LIKQTCYEKDGNIYIPTSEIENKYHVFPRIYDYYNAFYIREVSVLEGAIMSTGGYLLNPIVANFIYSPPPPLFEYCNYAISSMDNLLKETTERTFIGNDTISKKTTYQYDQTHLQATNIKTTDSQNDTITIQKTYPGDYATVEPYQSMLAKNMLAFPVEIKTMKSNVFLSLTRTNYGKNWPANSNLILPTNIENQTKGQPLPETRIQFINYNTKGNPLHIVRDSSDKVVYLWCYQHQYPIAEIKGATYDEVCLKVGNNNLQAGKNLLDSIAGKLQPSAPDFTTINNLRSQLPNALITTYTYKPLIGLATRTDPRGITTKYDYDPFGRLQAIKDDNDKIMEKYEYHYQNN
jgi:YD repeat-containing protein